MPNYDLEESVFLTDPYGLKGMTCALPGCDKPAVYADEDTFTRYLVAGKAFCSDNHAIFYNNKEIIGSGVNCYSNTSMYLFGSDQGDTNPATTPVEYQYLMNNNSFEFKSISAKLDHLEEPHYVQFARVIDENAFITELIDSKNKWYILPDLLDAKMKDRLVRSGLTRQQMYSKAQGTLKAAEFADILLVTLKELFESPIYRPKLNDVKAKKPKVLTDSYHVELGPEYIYYWRHSKKHNIHLNKKLMVWGADNLPYVHGKGLYKGQVIGEGKVVYEFLMYAGVGVRYTIDEASGRNLPPEYELAVQVYIKTK